MILPFSLETNGKQTYFPIKILRSLLDSNTIRYSDAIIAAEKLYKKIGRVLYIDWSLGGDPPPKMHTIRRDAQDRWKAGNKINFVIYHRRPDQFQFAPIITCQSAQKIIIKYLYSKQTKGFTNPIVIVDDKVIRGNALDRLAVNDGFENRRDFFEYFNSDFTGKIIHWTNLKY